MKPALPLRVALIFATACAASRPPPGPAPVVSPPAPAAPVASSAPASSAKAPEPQCDADAVATRAPTSAEAALADWLSRAAGTPRPELEAALDAACGKSPERDGTRPPVGDPAACTLLGVMLASGDGVQQDAFRAERYFRRAAVREGFDLGGCELAASSVAVGILSESSACDRAGHACPPGCEKACGAALETMRSRSIVPLAQSCEGGRAAACFLLGIQQAFGAFVQHLGNLAESDGDRAAQSLRRACNAGFGAACGFAALYAASDVGNPKADEKARELALRKRACALGDGGSCTRVGLAAGKIASGRKSFERACQLGEVLVCRDLAKLLAEGKELPRDLGAAAKYEKLGAAPWF